MTANDDIISDIIKREGGFVDRSDDHGGATNMGVTVTTLSSWRKNQCSTDDVRMLTEAEARQILTELYLTKPGLDQIRDDQLRSLAVDWAVNSGPAAPAKALQVYFGLSVDGLLGPVTIGKINAAYAPKTRAALLAERIRSYGRIITANPSQSAFAAGWLNRVADQVATLAPA